MNETMTWVYEDSHILYHKPSINILHILQIRYQLGRFIDIYIDIVHWLPCIHLYTSPTLVFSHLHCHEDRPSGFKPNVLTAPRLSSLGKGWNSARMGDLLPNTRSLVHPTTYGPANHTFNQPCGTSGACPWGKQVETGLSVESVHPWKEAEVFGSPRILVMPEWNYL